MIESWIRTAVVIAVTLWEGVILAVEVESVNHPSRREKQLDSRNLKRKGVAATPSTIQSNLSPDRFQPITGWITFPPTSVNRKSRPL